ncbi:MAG: hypothetical protein HYX24_04805 [Candidatus Aenigmarchaeota archaeon]|nr:hypothetical protein [Candidatus Aenigmarchaeota archaeon]
MSAKWEAYRQNNTRQLENFSNVFPKLSSRMDYLRQMIMGKGGESIDGFVYELPLDGGQQERYRIVIWIESESIKGKNSEIVLDQKVTQIDFYKISDTRNPPHDNGAYLLITDGNKDGNPSAAIDGIADSSEAVASIENICSLHPLRAPFATQRLYEDLIDNLGKTLGRKQTA